MPDLGRTTGLSDFYFLDAAEPDDAVHKIVAAVRDRIPHAFGLDPIRDIQVLCPMNRGGLGARSLNIELQKALNPPGEIRVERFGWTFCSGDKVMQVENNYDREVYNGDLGRNLLYTGVTRAKRLVVLVGQRKALAIAVRNQGTRRRWSKLREWLLNKQNTGSNAVLTAEAP